ncbi:class I SAM-dependent methyltransferase [Aspergillus homomorphus CBS 101889]|uniref:Ubiquinone/menaquinone biosynthesis-related protein n=1 Tax=Aspergillus homomorphus (strain CBS 101889) TaxID=1450537 RepID=A0A395HJU7_ASPHC|nr:ubiquinone/menaquinone biosynthesis-related protein [Aspergillus homomorphus CBS 101889]RAL08212.1 ubiquinone/menaquinone biosynthesis-related protein [Aspergillus homomorphus CBS 101889]
MCPASFRRALFKVPKESRIKTPPAAATAVPKPTSGGAAKTTKIKTPPPPPPPPPPFPQPGTPSPATLLSKRANPALSEVRKDETRMSPRVMTVLGVSVLGLSAYIGYLYASYQREVTHSQSLSITHDVSDRYNRTAGSFDADVEMSEKLMRLGTKRRELVQRARGDVLEVSCGTGRNIEYYDFGALRRGIVDESTGRIGVRGCRSVTFVDLSPEMVEIARRKYAELVPVEFRVEDAAKVTGPSATVTGGGKKYYDTVVQTMGLCSLPDPVGTLRHLGSLVDPQRGEILLLEHGRSHYAWLNRVLDNLAPAHADRHGCWWNRDIGEIVRESGLEVVEAQRWHFGTTWKYVLRPARKTAE